MVTPDKLFITKFGVANEYLAVSHEERRLVVISAGPLINEDVFENYQFTPPKEGENVKYYSINDVDSIYTHLAAVKDEKDLVMFAHKFGLLGIIDRKPMRLAHMGIVSVKQRLFIQDDVEESLRVAENMRSLLDIWGQIEKGFVLGKNQFMDFAEEAYPEYTDLLKKVDEKTFTKAYVTLRVSKNLGGVRPTANFDSSGNPIPGFAYFSLIDAIWHSFYLSITGQAKFKQCPFCDSWHTGRGDFCPPPPITKRSLCENAYSQKKHRIRTKIKKLHQQGKTIEEISKTMDMDYEEISKILEGGMANG